MSIFRQKIIDISTNTAITDAVNVRLQPSIHTYPTGVITMTIPVGSVANSGWREATVTQNGKYDVYVDTGGGYNKDTALSPMAIYAEGAITRTWVFEHVAITGTYDTVQSLTVGAGVVAAATLGGTLPTLVGAASTIRIFARESKSAGNIERAIKVGNIAVAANVITFDIWKSDAGRDASGITADIYLYLQD